MTLLSAVAFSSFLLENNDLFSAKLTYDLTGNLGLCQHWRTNFGIAFAADKKHIRQNYFSPTAPSSFSILTISPSDTRYCLPPVLITAYFIRIS